MSNSVVFLLIAVGLSVLGTCAVWLHGRPRRSRSSVELFNRSLQALAANDTQRREPLSGVTVRRAGEPAVNGAREAHVEPVEEAEAAVTRSRRPSPRPAPRPAPRVNRRPAESREASPSHEGSRSGS